MTTEAKGDAFRGRASISLNRVDGFPASADNTTRSASAARTFVSAPMRLPR
jgi:hypothetical protein